MTVQVGHWRDPLPWALALPMFPAVLAAISLAGLPDRAAGGAGLWLAFEGIVGGPGARAPEGRIDALMVNVLVHTPWFDVASLVGVGGG